MDPFNDVILAPGTYAAPFSTVKSPPIVTLKSLAEKSPETRFMSFSTVRGEFNNISDDEPERSSSKLPKEAFVNILKLPASGRPVPVAGISSMVPPVTFILELEALISRTSSSPAPVPQTS